MLLVLIAFIWGSTFVVVKDAIDQSSVLVFLALRFSLGAMVLAALFRGRLWATPQLRRSTLIGGGIAGLCLMLLVLIVMPSGLMGKAQKV